MKPIAQVLVISMLISPLLTFPQLNSPRIVIDPQGHSAKIQGLVYTPDGKKIISVSEDKSVRLWNAGTGKMERKFELQIGDGPEGLLYACSLSTDGRLLAVGGYNLTPDRQVYITIIDLVDNDQVGYAVGHVGAINGLAFSNDNKHLVSGSDDGTVKIWKMERVEEALPLEAVIEVGVPVKFLALNPITMDLAIAAQGKRVIQVYNLSGLGNGAKKFQPKMLGKHKGEINKLAYSADGAFLASSCSSKEFNLWKADGTFIREVGKGSLINAIAFSHDSKILVALDDQGKGVSYSLPELSVFTRFSGHDNAVFAAAFNPLDETGYSIASVGGSNNEILLWNPVSGKITGKINGKGKAIEKVSFTNGLELAISQDSKGGKETHCRGFDFGLMKLSTEAPAPPAARAKMLGVNQSSPFSLDINGGKVISNSPDSDGRILDYCVSKNGSIIIASDFSLKMYDSNGNLAKEFVGHIGGVRTVSLSADERYLASGGEDQTIILWKLSDTGAAPSLRQYFNEEKWGDFFTSLPIDSLTNEHSKKAWAATIDFLKSNGHKSYKIIEQAYHSLGETILPFASLFISNDNEWVCWAYKGYFVCSSAGSQYFGWHVNKGNKKLADFYAADQYFNVLYRPEEMKNSLQQGIRTEDLLRAKGERLFDLSRLHKPSAGFFNIGKLNESGKLDYRDGLLVTNEKALGLEVILKDGGGGIKEVLIYQNDKLMVSDRAINTNTDYQELTKTYTLELVNDINEFTVVTKNYQQVASYPDKIKIKYTGDAIVTSSLHILAIGINKYKNSAYNLNFAMPDAKAFASKLNQQGARIFKKINLHELYDEEATKEKITGKFQVIAKEANLEDVFVFFYAGHGSLDEDNKDGEGSGMFYFVPSDVTKIYGDPQQLIAKGFSAEEMKQNLMKIKSTKQLVLMDACHSGGALKSLKVRAAGGDEKAIFQLARSSGVACIASSGTKQFATEFDVLKHGVFTYALLEALEGKAANNTASITVNGLKSYMEERVPELTSQYGGEAQYPTGYINGSDFPIALVNN